ncbi:MAG: DUF4402 domain-containing protein [Bacteroidota bacterium]
MKKLIIALAIVLGAGFASNVMAQGTATASGSSSAKIFTNIGITAVNPLAFGTFTKPTAVNGTVTIATDDTRTASLTAGLYLVTTNGNSIGAASFDITGDGNSTYSITVPPTTSSISNGTTTLSIGTFLSDPSGTGTLTTGAQTIHVGATLTVTPAATVGNYTGTFPVTVAYN